MKTNAIKELHGKGIEELRTLLQTAKEELSMLQMDKMQGKLKNTSNILYRRKDIARIATIIKEKENIK